MRLKLEKDAVNVITWMYDLLRTKETETTTLHPYFFSPPSCLWAICSATVSYLFIFNDYCQSSYLKIYQANLCHILWVGKTIAVGDQSEIGYLVPQGTLP